MILARLSNYLYVLVMSTKKSKKEAFVGFFETKRTNAESLFNLAKDAIQPLNFDLNSIVGECFDGASNMCSIHGGLATMMKETSPLSIYVHCYAHRLNHALEGSLYLV